MTPTLHIGGVDFCSQLAARHHVVLRPMDVSSRRPSMVQGTQQFDVVDPRPLSNWGSFNALVSRGTGIDYIVPARHVQ